MSSLNDFLKKDDLYLTLTNEQGEVLRTEKAAWYIKPLRTKTIIKWETNGKYTNIFPFTVAVLHGKQKVFKTLFIKAILPSTETVALLEI